jgi:predicted RNA-binding protein associated with RNAse of E/G family
MITEEQAREKYSTSKNEIMHQAKRGKFPSRWFYVLFFDIGEVAMLEPDLAVRRVW